MADPDAIKAPIGVMRAVLALLWVALFPSQSHAQHVWQGSYPEGPVWIGTTLYWAEMTADRVMAWDVGTAASDARTLFNRPGCGPTAIARYRRQDLLVLCHLDGSLAHLDARGTLFRMIRTATDGTVLRDPNDASADGAGGVWFTDPGRFSARAPAEGRLYHLDPAGRLTRHVDGLAYANGVHVDAKARRLLVSEHLARRVLAYPLDGPRLGPPKVLVDLNALGLSRPAYPEAGPDGLEIGPDGTLWIAEYGAGRLLGWRPDANLVAVVKVETPFLTNIAFGAGGETAMTGALDNRRPPFPGRIWTFPAKRLTELAGQTKDKK